MDERERDHVIGAGDYVTGEEPSLELIWGKADGSKVAGLQHYDGRMYWIFASGQSMELTRNEFDAFAETVRKHQEEWR